MLTLRPKFRYPVFFTGILLMEISGFLLRYAHLQAAYSELLVILGFLILLASLLLPGPKV